MSPQKDYITQIKDTTTDALLTAVDVDMAHQFEAYAASVGVKNTVAAQPSVETATVPSPKI